MNEELKRCPFCGALATVVDVPLCPKYEPYNGDDIWVYTVACVNPDCIIYDADDKYFFTSSAAVEAWNRRVDDPCAAALARKGGDDA